MKKTFIQTMLLGAFGVILMSGCAQKIQIKALNPAEVGEMASKKTIAVSQFNKDDIGLSGKIESKIASHKLNKKKYFTVLSRKDLDKILQEQELQSSELMNENTSSKIGKLIGAQAMVNGEIVNSNAKVGSYTEAREKCLSYYKDGSCAQFKHYRVTCKTLEASVSANINIVDVTTGTIIYGDNISKEYSANSCKYGSAKVLSKSQVINRLTNSIANDFVRKITPNYIYFSVTLLEDIELDNVSDKINKDFENALKYIKNKRYVKSEKILTSILDSLNGNSYVVAYDLGVVKEALGKLDEAKKMYKLADDKTTEPIKELDIALIRIDTLIAKKIETNKQLNK